MVAGMCVPAMGEEHVSSGCLTLDASEDLSADEKLLETAKAALLYEIKSQTLVYAWNPDQKLDPSGMNKIMTALLALENAGRLTIYYSIPYFCAMALNIPVTPSMLLNIIALSSFVAMINAFLPMPGSAGGTEATFILMFSTIFSHTDAASIMILWRSITFYQTLIIGGLVFMYGKMQKDVPIDESKELPRTYAAESLKEEMAGL
jgi:hypothetical protein